MSFQCVCRTSRTHRALLHSSAPVLWKKRRVLRDPTKPSEPIQVAPNESKSSPIGNRAQHRSRETRPPFVRDALPHAEVEVAPESDAFHGRNPSFRRRSPARNEQDWSRRTGRWSASRFGGGHHQGPQMGLREDRPPSYGLNRTSRAGPADDFSRPRDSPSRRPTEGDRARPVVNRSGQGQFQSEPYRGDTERPPQLRSENSFRRPQRRPFGLQPEGDDYPSSRPFTASGWVPWDHSQSSQNIRKHSFTAEDDLDTTLHLDMTALSPSPRLLKNRNQPTVSTPVFPAPPASKAKPLITQPPPKALD
ncbi:hypothetical protein FB451DRAFT_1362361 [Mycena latifolia]|nr:hypothetical protein FB451DRAFT_1362361 [Mycena latifolia]